LVPQTVHLNVGALSGASTLERWYYTARSASDPVAALRNRLRDDVACLAGLAEALLLGAVGELVVLGVGGHGVFLGGRWILGV
jgi:hypothetical protein